MCAITYLPATQKPTSSTLCQYRAPIENLLGCLDSMILCLRRRLTPLNMGKLHTAPVSPHHSSVLYLDEARDRLDRLGLSMFEDQLAVLPCEASRVWPTTPQLHAVYVENHVRCEVGNVVDLLEVVLFLDTASEKNLHRALAEGLYLGAKDSREIDVADEALIGAEPLQVVEHVLRCDGAVNDDVAFGVVRADDPMPAFMAYDRILRHPEDLC
ncbi:hypothetical protein CP533_3562 [Ophiocordyceps camponoti-saundersi (nom. inval.)]|nr:hypothetical protein CP533_3562 [Ophiocordyceps camponoti-saundersi (nom. inval.)]